MMSGANLVNYNGILIQKTNNKQTKKDANTACPLAVWTQDSRHPLECQDEMVVLMSSLVPPLPLSWARVIFLG